MHFEKVSKVIWTWLFKENECDYMSSKSHWKQVSFTERDPVSKVLWSELQIYNELYKDQDIQAILDYNALGSYFNFLFVKKPFKKNLSLWNLHMNLIFDWIRMKGNES